MIVLISFRRSSILSPGGETGAGHLDGGQHSSAAELLDHVDGVEVVRDEHVVGLDAANEARLGLLDAQTERLEGGGELAAATDRRLVVVSCGAVASDDLGDVLGQERHGRRADYGLGVANVVQVGLHEPRTIVNDLARVVANGELRVALLEPGEKATS